MAERLWQAIAGPTKTATVVPGLLDLPEDRVKLRTAPLSASVSYGGATALAYTPFVDAVPASRTVAPLPGAYGSVAAAQDVCARDLACLGVRSQENGPIALLYPGCSKPRVITDLVAAPGSTTWVARR